MQLFVSLFKVNDWCRTLICRGDSRHMLQDSRNFMQLWDLHGRYLSNRSA